MATFGARVEGLDLCELDAAEAETPSTSIATVIYRWTS